MKFSKNIAFIVILLFTVFASSIPQSVTAADSDWELTSPLPTRNSYKDVVYGNGKYVAVGEYGTIVTSEDGTGWQKQNVDTFHTLWGIAYGNGIFVAVGSGGTVATSSDGTTWTVRNVGAMTLTNIDYGNGKFIATVSSNKGDLMLSTDGIKWDFKSAVTPANLRDIAYGGGWFVAVGSSGTRIASKDGETWTAIAVTDANDSYPKIVYGNDRFILMQHYGAVYRSQAVSSSAVPSSWTISRQAKGAGIESFNAVTYANGKFLAVDGRNDFYTSSDNGASWVLTDKKSPQQVNKLIYADGRFLFIGNFGSLFTSTDGLNWTDQIVGTRQSVLAVDFVDGKFIAQAAYDAVMTSVDGKVWDRHVIPSALGVMDLAYGNGIYVIVEWNGNTLVSTDAINWTINERKGTFTQVSYGNGKFVAIGSEGIVWQSTNGIDWTQVYTVPGGQYRAYGIGYGAGKFVVVGPKGAVSTSPDGQVWTEQISGTETPLLKVTYGNGKFLAIGYEGLILSSPDGITWSTKANLTQASFNGITYTNGQFVGLGSKGEVLFSKDGETWSKEQLATEYALSDAAYGNGVYVVVGQIGLMFKKAADPIAQVANVSYEAGDHGTINGTGEQVVVGSTLANIPDVTPNAGYRFVGWSGDGGTTKLNRQQLSSLSITGDVTYVAYYLKVTMGDANGDGKVTSADALLLNNYIKGKITLTPEQLEALDMNGDGKWDAEDVKAILAIAAGKG